MAGFTSSRAKAPPPIDIRKSVDAGAASIDEALRAVTGVLNSHDDEIKKLNGGLSLGTNTVGRLKTLSFKMPDDPPWKTAPLTIHADMLAGTLEALMEPGGLVRLRGSSTSNPAGTHPAGLIAGSPVLTMASGYRPVVAAGFPNLSLVGAVATPNGVSVATSGLINVGVACTTVYLDGLQWYATAAAPPHQFDEANWPLRVEHGFDRARGLMVLGFRLSGQAGQNVGMGTPHVDWQDLGDGALRINGVWGLQWGQRYEVRIYVTPEQEEE